MHRVTVLKRGRYLCEGEITVGDPSWAASVEMAGRAVCEAKRKTFPSPATVRVERRTGGGRWVRVTEVVIGG